MAAGRGPATQTPHPARFLEEFPAPQPRPQNSETPAPRPAKFLPPAKFLAPLKNFLKYFSWVFLYLFLDHLINYLQRNECCLAVRYQWRKIIHKIVCDGSSMYRLYSRKSTWNARRKYKNFTWARLETSWVQNAFWQNEKGWAKEEWTAKRRVT